MTSPDISKLHNLEFQKQSTFAYLTCERLYPNYVYFSKNYDFGDPNELRKSIEFIKSTLLTSHISKKDTDVLISRLDTLTPQPADFDTVLASSALDACNVVYETLNFLLDHDVNRLDRISTSATDTVDMYIQEIDGLDFNTDINFQQKIDSHPLMIKEVAVQNGIISYLRKIDHINHNDISTLVALQGNNKGNIQLH